MTSFKLVIWKNHYHHWISLKICFQQYIHCHMAIALERHTIVGLETGYDNFGQNMNVELFWPESNKYSQIIKNCILSIKGVNSHQCSTKRLDLHMISRKLGRFSYFDPNVRPPVIKSHREEIGLVIILLMESS